MAQDGLQYGAVLTATSSGLVGTSVQSYGFRASQFRCTATSTGAGLTYVDFTGAVATTSTGYPLNVGETFQGYPSPRNLTGFYTGISAITSAGVTTMLRVVALS